MGLMSLLYQVFPSTSPPGEEGTLQLRVDVYKYRHSSKLLGWAEAQRNPGVPGGPAGGEAGPMVSTSWNFLIDILHSL